MPAILQKWEELIANTLNRLRIDRDFLSEEEIGEIIHQSELEGEKVPKLLIEGIINRSDIRDKQQFVQVHQAMLIRLLNKLYTSQQNQEINDKMLTVYHSVGRHLEQSLSFIEDFFSDYFDRSERVPAPYFFVSTSELCRQLVLLKEKLAVSTGVDSTLTTILLNNFTRYCNGEKTSATYKELSYQRELMKELLSDKTLQSEASVREVLFFFNFNDDDYVAYLYNRLDALTVDLPSLRDKIISLRFEQKTVNQLRAKLNTTLNDSMPALKEQVTRWIEEEVKFLEAAPDAEIPLNAGAAQENKIQLALSVARLALLLRLMVIDKMIVNRVIAQVLRVTVKTMATLQTGDISFGSLETKYHNPDRGTISAVKDMLFRWINILNKL